MRRLALLSICVLAATANASPTSNEFQACHRRGAATLEYCLNKQPGYDQPACWTQSRQAVDACYADVRASHSRK